MWNPTQVLWILPILENEICQRLSYLVMEVINDSLQEETTESILKKESDYNVEFSARGHN